MDYVIPMLPDSISNELCSLNPNEDKLTFSAILELDKKGNRVNYSIEPTVINSNKRFTYHEANEIIKSRKGAYSETLLQMNTLANLLHEKRKEYGSIDFDLAEAVFRLDDNGMPYDWTLAIGGTIKDHLLKNPDKPLLFMDYEIDTLGPYTCEISDVIDIAKVEDAFK